ncbi:MAG: AMP-binding protein [Paracoccaceae bacterium]
MYQVNLTESYFPIQDQEEVLETTVGGLLRQTAATNPDDPALTEVDMTGALGRRWTFGSLLSDAEVLALALSTRFEPGERICVWAPNVPEWVLLEYACALAGLTLVTANPAYQPQELRYVLDQSRSSALFLTCSFRGNPMWDIAQEAAQGLPNLKEIVDIQDRAAVHAQGSRPAELPDVQAGDAAQIQYTSGTTGFPKGAVLSHRGLTNNARFYAARLQAKPGEPWASVMPLFHTAGCAMAVLGSLQSASPLYLFTMFDPVAFLRIIESERIALTGGVPTMIVAMLEVLDHQSFDTSSMRSCMSGGSMVPPQLVRAIKDKMGCGVQTVYGQTECSPLITMHHLDESEADACNTIGQPMPQHELAIRDPQTDAILPVGEIGEICVRGYLIMIEYNDNPEATAATVDAEGWLRTGDLGRMDSRGYVAVTGRVKEMIIRGGENLFPAEIENVLLEHPDVAEIAVVGLPDDKWGEIVAAFVRPSDGAQVDPQALKSHCRAHLAPMKSPVVWCQMESFPLTGSGKIRKFALRDQFIAGEITALPTAS